MKLYCYCCGEDIDNAIALISHGERTDRVFTALPDHVENFDGVNVIVVYANAPSTGVENG